MSIEAILTSLGYGGNGAALLMLFIVVCVIPTVDYIKKHFALPVWVPIQLVSVVVAGVFLPVALYAPQIVKLVLLVGFTPSTLATLAKYMGGTIVETVIQEPTGYTGDVSVDIQSNDSDAEIYKPGDPIIAKFGPGNNQREGTD